MKIFGLIFAVALLLAGCGEKSDKPAGGTNAASGGSLVTAPVDYLSTITKGEQTAVKTIDTTSLNQAIQLFNVEKGRNPKDLNELVKEKYIPQVPTPPFGTKLDYDANSGTVKVVKQ
jgi:PBP1b-binding outer membrane lipoprotein LpoB